MTFCVCGVCNVLIINVIVFVVLPKFAETILNVYSCENPDFSLLSEIISLYLHNKVLKKTTYNISSCLHHRKFDTFIDEQENSGRRVRGTGLFLFALKWSNTSGGAVAGLCLL